MKCTMGSSARQVTLLQAGLRGNRVLFLIETGASGYSCLQIGLALFRSSIKRKVSWNVRLKCLRDLESKMTLHYSVVSISSSRLCMQKLLLCPIIFCSVRLLKQTMVFVSLWNKKKLDLQLRTSVFTVRYGLDVYGMIWYVCWLQLGCHSVAAVQYSAVQYSTVQYSTVQCSTVQYSSVQYSTVQYSTVKCSEVQYSTVQYSIVQYKTVQYSTVQYSTVKCSEVQYSRVECITVQKSAVKCSTVQCSTVKYSTVQ
jgi:hypothetical protein